MTTDRSDSSAEKNGMPYPGSVITSYSIHYTKLYESFVPRTANDEVNDKDLPGALQDLVAAVCDRVSSNADLTSADCVEPPPDSSFLVDLVRGYGWAGPYCRDIGMDCLGDQLV